MARLCFLSLLVAFAAAAIPDEDWGYVDVRPGAHSFWWLYGANLTDASQRAKQPLIMWLQGGPGASSTGYGNFAEMGPLDWYLNPRQSAWTNAPANLLFVDNPVGAGFSYVDSLTLLPKTNAAIAADLVTLASAFFSKYVELQDTPFYVFTESYGGKMAATFAPALYAAIQAGTVKANFKGYVMGDSWIDGTDHVDAWCPFLRKVDLLDDAQYATCMVPTKACDAATAAGDWQGAINAWGDSEGVISQLTDDVDFYNILIHGTAGDILMDARGNVMPNTRRVKPELKLSPEALALAPSGVRADALQTLYRNHLSVYLGDPLDALMNGPIRKKLGIIPCVQFV